MIDNLYPDNAPCFPQTVRKVGVISGWSWISGGVIMHQDDATRALEHG